jgi:hypothetical protein
MFFEGRFRKTSYELLKKIVRDKSYIMLVAGAFICLVFKLLYSQCYINFMVVIYKGL